MSTEINITVEGGNLSDVAWSNQWQNRQNEEQRRQQEKEAKRKAAEEAEQKKLEEQKKAAGSGTSNKYRPDDPAANRLGIGIEVAEGFLQTQGANSYKLWSGDRTSSVVVSFPTVETPNPPLRWGNPTYNHLSQFGSCIWAGNPYPEYTFFPGANGYFGRTSNSQLIVWRWAPSETPPAYGSGGNTSVLYSDFIANPGTYYTTSAETASVLIQQEWLKTSPAATNLVQRYEGFEPFGNNDLNIVDLPGEQYANETISTTYSYSGTINICLPVSSDSMIVYLASYQYKMRGYAGDRTDRTVSIQVFDNYISEPYRAYSGLGYNWVIEEYRRVGVDTNVFIIESFDEEYENKDVSEKCFLVSTSAVREIPVPSGLSDKMATLYKGLDSRPPSPQVRPFKQGAEYGTSTSGIGLQGEDYPSWQLGQARTRANAELPYVSQAAYNVEAAKPGYSSNPNLGLAKQYGLGNLRTTYHLQVGQTTPAIFAALEKASEVLASSSSSALNSYADVYNSYITGTPFPRIYVDGLLTTTSPGIRTANYEYTKTMPESVTQAVPSAQFKKNTKRPYSTPLYSGTLLQAWNWGASEYCRQKLLGMGFSPADLTP